MRELTRHITSEATGHVVLDMEAGVEHLSRGTTRNADVLLVVAEPYYKSLETADRVRRLGSELGIPRVMVIANKVRPSDDTSLRQFAERHGMELASFVPYDDSVSEADREGIAPIDFDPSGVMVRETGLLAQRLLAA